MNTPYSYEIIKVDEAARTMEIIYSAEGHPTMHIGARLPYADEQLEAVVAMYAPVAYWTSIKAAVAVPALGSGVIDPEKPLATITPMEQLTLKAARKRKLAELADWRYEQEVAGVTVLGHRLASDRSSQAAAAAKLLSMDQGLLTEANWKTLDGKWVILDHAKMRQVVAAITRHVEACFNEEARLSAEVWAAETVDQVAAIVTPDFFFDGLNG